MKEEKSTQEDKIHKKILKAWQKEFGDIKQSSGVLYDHLSKRFDKSKEGEVERVREMNKELYGSLLKYGAVPYKTPLWAAKTILDQSDPNTVKLFKRIKKTMDPNFIMNPGRWGLEEE